MRVTRISFSLMVLAAFAAGANAQTPIDPKVIINKIDPVCTPAVLCYDGSSSDPLIESFTSPTTFVYTGAMPLLELFINLIDVPPLTAFQCQTDIWTDCTIAPAGSNTVQFHLFGIGGLNAPNDFGGGTCAICANEMVSGEGATFTIQPLVSETPEPDSIILFGTGLILLFIAAKQRVRTALPS